MKGSVVFFIFLALLMIFGVSPVYCERIIDTKTLTVTFHVPPRPVTIDMDNGFYNDYSIVRGSNTIFVTAP